MTTEKLQKFHPGQTVRGVHKGGRWTAPEYPVTEIEGVHFIDRTGWRGSTMYNYQVEEIRFKGDYRWHPATKAHVLTEDEFERIRPEHEAMLAKRQAATNRDAMLQHEYVRCAIIAANLTNDPTDEQVSLLRRFFNLGYGWHGTCVYCGTGHRRFEVYDHEPTAIGQLFPPEEAEDA